MSEKISLLFPDRSLNFKKLSDTTVHDLGMDSLIKKLSPQEKEQVYIMNVMKLMTDDPFTAKYRADVFDDIYKNRNMRDELLKLLDHISFLKDYGSFKRDHDHEPGIWDLLHRLDEIKDYIECIEAIHKCLSKNEVHSEGLLHLKSYVHDIYTGGGLDALKEDVANLRADTGNLKSVTVGINLNERFEAAGMGVISVNSKPFTKSSIISHFIDKVSGSDSISDEAGWNGELKYDEVSVRPADDSGTDFVPPAFSPLALMSMRPIPESENSERSVTSYMDAITGRMLSKTVKHLREVLGKYALITISDVTDLMPEFVYYIRWAEYMEKLTAKGFKFCKPKVTLPGEKNCSMSSKGLYNLKLLEDGSKTPKDIVENDLDFCTTRQMYILTGANRGGKTTITQAVGQLFFLAQSGIYVTGKEFEFTPADDIFTHFPADEDKTLDLGRLGEECKRFKEIYEESTEKSLLLLNETFSTTSFEEGYYIAKDCIKALLKKGVRTIYNTHMHKLAFDIDEINDETTDFKAASLIVVSKNGERSYEVKVSAPEGMSYAGDIARKYGVTYEDLVDVKTK